jgi:hypothetical protein
MKRETLTLVGRAHSLAFDDGTASWKIAIRRSADPNHLIDFNLQARQTQVLEQFEAMDEGQLIGVIAELPPVRLRVPGAPLTVTRLELLGKAQEVARA